MKWPVLPNWESSLKETNSGAEGVGSLNQNPFSPQAVWEVKKGEAIRNCRRRVAPWSVKWSPWCHWWDYQTVR
uniref:Uncharacterized protein n=1 Tax=Macaca fascicularis TaxID=9541 RepID=Q8HXJ8_MACFA|nr:hypothetical protein [Macaca fascicularis]